MKQMSNKVMQWLLIVALVVTMQPWAPSTSTAAPGDPVYFEFNDFSTVQSAPTEVNTNIVDIAGTFNQVTSLSYRIEKIVNGTVAEASNSSTQPIITGGNSFRFSAVTIYEGLNRIKVLGVNSVGNVVSGEAYVNFSNVPVISEVKLSDGRPLLQGQPIITSRANEAISVKAANATHVSINGVEMFGGSGSTFLLNNLGLKPGYNKLVILARNGTKTYEVTRSLIYFNGSLTVYDTKWDTIPPTSIEDNPTYDSPISGVTISTNVILRTNASATPIPPTFTISIVNEAGTVVVPATSTTYATSTVVGDYTVYPIVTNANMTTTNVNGKYFIQIMDTSVAGSPYYRLPFTFRDSTSPFIKGIKQAYDMAVDNGIADYVSTSSFLDNSTVYTSPVWTVLDIGNETAGSSGTNVSVTASAGGAALSADEFHYDTYPVRDKTNERAIIIDKMPAGTVKLTFRVERGNNPALFDTIERTITFVPAPSIQINSIYNGQVFETSTLPLIEGRLINFNLLSDNELKTVNIILNGTRVNLFEKGTIYKNANTAPYKPGDFTLNPTTNGMNLLPGANTLIFEGIANGVPVTTTFTVYFFSKDNPIITGMQPVPYVLDPLLDDDLIDVKRKMGDSDVKFARTGDKQFSTTERSLDLLFDVKDLTSLEVLIDGRKTATATVSSATGTEGQITLVDDPVLLDQVKLYIEVPKDSPSAEAGKAIVGPYTDARYQYKLRLSRIELPQTGSASITITVRKGTVSVSETITIIRDLSPYLVLSPRLPNESVINSNFLNVSIKAEGATSVLLGKAQMVKGSGDIFRYQLKNLKAGKNTIKFTVLQGTSKINGSFVVNYAGDSSVSAEYKAKIPTSGKLSIFKGELTVQFPKNTFLRQANVSPGQDVKTVNLFDAQELYFGIADRTDGRTLKRYNAVGETDLSGTPQDGTLLDIAPRVDATDRLMPRLNFNYASNLYWIDAGFFQGTGLVNDYQLVEARHPYITTNNGDDIFYIRAYDPNKWMEPSQRGTISLKYDTNIVDALARNLSIWRYTAQGWVNVGGTVDTKKKTVTSSFDGFGYYAVMSLRYSFSDIGGHSYARNALETMFARGIMTNKDNNSFGVYDNITRGEFAQVLVKMLDIPLEYDPNNMTFDDVIPIDFPDALWNYRYIETAVKKGYVKGRSPRLFWPNDNLTREEAAVMIARALNLVKNNADLEKDKAALVKLFTDVGKVNYSASAILAIQKAGYIAGIPNNLPGVKNSFRFEPESNLTRADAAVIVERIMKKLKKL